MVYRAHLSIGRQRRGQELDRRPNLRGARRTDLRNIGHGVAYAEHSRPTFGVGRACPHLQLHSHRDVGLAVPQHQRRIHPSSMCSELRPRPVSEQLQPSRGDILRADRAVEFAPSLRRLRCRLVRRSRRLRQQEQQRTRLQPQPKPKWDKRIQRGDAGHDPAVYSPPLANGPTHPGAPI